MTSSLYTDTIEITHMLIRHMERWHSTAPELQALRATLARLVRASFMWELPDIMRNAPADKIADYIRDNLNNLTGAKMEHNKSVHSALSYLYERVKAETAGTPPAQ